MEKKVLASLLQSRSAWESLKGAIDPNRDLSPEGAMIFTYVTEFYETDKKALKVDAEIVSGKALREISNNKLGEVVAGAITSLSAIDVSATNVVKELLSVKQSSLGNKIASILANPSKTGGVKELMNEYLELESQSELGEGSQGDSETYRGTKATSLVQESFSPAGLIPIYPLVLNKQIDGGARRGHHILVFGPTEIGKSLLTFDMCYGFLRHDHTVVFVENEDPASDSQMRMMSRLTRMTKYDIMANPEKADEILSKRNWDKFILANLAPGSFAQIAKLVDEYNPSVVVLNQLRNINVGVDHRTQALEKAATEARNLAKGKKILVVSVSQAADSATGKTVLERGDVDGSNVGIPGQVDLMIGFGATQEMEQNNWRTISFPKNKLSGLHAPITVQIDPLTSRVME